MTSIVALLFVAVASLTVAEGSVFTIKLKVVKDVTLERGSTNFNYLKFLLVGQHPGYPNKRSLLQFTNVPYSCRQVISARLYLYFVYAHKASFMSSAQVPTFSRTVVAHQVFKSWSESEATSTKRFRHVYWSRKLLGLGNDASSSPAGPGVVVNPSRRGWYSLGVTRAVSNWRNGAPNYGLLIRATNEYRLGRDFRFASNADPNRARHAYIQVICRHSSFNPFPLRKGKVGPNGQVPVQ